MEINSTGFGWIIVDKVRYNHDIIIHPNGTIKNRYDDFEGDNHILSKKEAEKIVGDNAVFFVVGTGQAGVLSIPDETKQFLTTKGIKLIAEITPKAIEIFNAIKDKKCGLFHTTC